MIKFLRFIPIQLTVFLVLGIIVGYYFHLKPIFLIIIISTLLIILYFFFRKFIKRFTPTFQFGLITVLLSFFIGLGSIVFNNHLNHQHHYSKVVDSSDVASLMCVISISKVLKQNDYYDKYEADVEQIGTQRAFGKILVNVERDRLKSPLKVDNKFVLRTEFKEIQKPLNPYGFNYKNYMKNQQVYHQINISKHQTVVFLASRRSIQGLAATLRERINYKLKKNGFGNDELALINALILGQKNAISDDLRHSYIRAGAIHILAISGLHIGILLMLLMFVFKPMHQIKYGKYIALFFIIICLWSYAIIAGLSSSVVRASTMFTAVALGLSFNRPTNVYNTLVISVFVLLLIHPYYLFDVGFQLSYTAVFAIVWLQPKISILWNPKFWLLKKVWQLFTVSIAAQIGVLPLSLYYFHQFPGLFFLSNLVIIPFLGIILIGGFLLIFLSVFDLLPELMGNLYRYIIRHMNGFVSWVSKQELFLIEQISYSYLLMLVTYGFILSFFVWSEKKNYYRLVPVLISIIVIQSVFIFEKAHRQSISEFIVFNKSRESLTGKRTGSEFLVWTSMDSLNKREPSIASYIIHEGIKTEQVQTISPIYKIQDEIILTLDSTAFYKTKSFKPSIVILQNSPRVNLERLIAFHQPSMIIADGSNYKSYVKKWEETCLKKKIPFHSTMQKGAFILKQ